MGVLAGIGPGRASVSVWENCRVVGVQFKHRVVFTLNAETIAACFAPNLPASKTQPTTPNSPSSPLLQVKDRLRDARIPLA